MGREEIDYSQYVYYDETSPTCLRWKQTIPRGGREGEIAGSVSKVSHPQITLFKKHKTIASVVYYLHYGIFEKYIYYKDGDKNNNKISNLSTESILKGRHKQFQERGRESCNAYKNNSTGLLGISFTKIEGRTYCVSSWTNTDGKQVHKKFSVNKLGIMQAVKEAVLVRSFNLNNKTI